VKRGAALAATAAAVCVVAGSTAGRTSTVVPLFGIVGGKVLYQQLVGYDPTTLHQLGRRVPLGAHRTGWSFSPDGRLLVLGNSANPCVAADLRFVDTSQPAMLGDVRLPPGPVQATAWPNVSRVLALLGPAPPNCLGARRTRIVLVDADARRVLATRWLRGSALRLSTVAGHVVVLLAPTGRLGAATLAVVDGTGNVRQKTLEALPAGQSFPRGEISQVSRPGLAVDSVGERAFVVPGGDRLAEVDLRTLRVDYHELAERTLAKGANGSTRQALWLGNGRLAVTGTNSTGRSFGGTVRLSTTPAGLRIVDTRDWSFRTIDPHVSQVARAGDVLLMQGSSYSFDGTRSTETNTGLSVYTLGGHEQYRLFEGESVAAFAAENRLYATVRATHGKSRTFVLDLATGNVAATTSTPVWNLLIGDAAPLYG
jgi:hypothetical protein